ncbi:cholesterol 24-hydroxylase-like isoform X1 [Pelobates fuscus]|uniref:cholesterol 24-hydroxylase-like isoform X1 n=2 Tax=Pelobates fuscus TaxID=191477 RepID=UPI002FE49736
MGLWVLLTWASLLLLSLAVICFLLYCGYIQHVHMKSDHIPGPPRDSFLFGHSSTIMKIAQNENEILYDQFLEWVKRYGPVIRINILHNVIILAVSPEAVKECLMSPKYQKDWFYDRMASMFGVRFLGKGLLSDRNYDHWHQQRRVIDPAFSKLYLIGLMAPFNENAEHLTQVLLEKADGKQVVKMHDLMNRLTLDIIAKVAFAMDLNCLEDEETPFPKAISLVMRGMVESRNPAAKFLLGKQAIIREVTESIRFLRETGKKCIEKRRRAIEEGDDVPDDILTQIFKGAALEKDFDPETLVDNFITFFIAGQETTANQLSFTVMELARNPPILEKAQAEVDEVIGAKRDLDYGDLGKLTYLSQVLKETLRLYPPAPGTSRELPEDLMIQGLKIPRKATIFLNSYIMARMEEYFDDPFTFNPDRFSPDAPKPNFTYFPFSLGPRSCIGRVFSQMEAKVVMAKLLQRFDIKLVEGQSFKILDTGTLRPLDGVICTLRQRTTKRALA